MRLEAISKTGYQGFPSRVRLGHAKVIVGPDHVQQHLVNEINKNGYRLRAREMKSEASETTKIPLRWFILSRRTLS